MNTLATQATSVSDLANELDFMVGDHISKICSSSLAKNKLSKSLRSLCQSCSAYSQKLNCRLQNIYL